MASRFFSKLMGAKDELQSHVLEVAETYMKRDDAGGSRSAPDVQVTGMACFVSSDGIVCLPLHYRVSGTGAGREEKQPHCAVVLGFKDCQPLAPPLARRSSAAVSFSGLCDGREAGWLLVAPRSACLAWQCDD
ncbi:hypothetical protein E2C01_003744 [Portunus trituberculatus]|uniref:Uncharacterized protein n=1 Tax=Portunus trituberculatus TaxID=210409 RepID=A0A5B7CQK8_PORTR|nr:hypothetical protein [Portunus trituberculatus]